MEWPEVLGYGGLGAAFLVIVWGVVSGWRSHQRHLARVDAQQAAAAQDTEQLGDVEKAVEQRRRIAEYDREYARLTAPRTPKPPEAPVADDKSPIANNEFLRELLERQDVEKVQSGFKTMAKAEVDAAKRARAAELDELREAARAEFDRIDREFAPPVAQELAWLARIPSAKELNARLYGSIKNFSYGFPTFEMPPMPKPAPTPDPPPPVIRPRGGRSLVAEALGATQPVPVAPPPPEAPKAPPRTTQVNASEWDRLTYEERERQFMLKTQKLGPAQPSPDPNSKRSQKKAAKAAREGRVEPDVGSWFEEKEVVMSQDPTVSREMVMLAEANRIRRERQLGGSSTEDYPQFRLLVDGTWGLSGFGPCPRVGDTIKVRRKNGTFQDCKIARIEDPGYGANAWIARFVRTYEPATGPRALPDEVPALLQALKDLDPFVERLESTAWAAAEGGTSKNVESMREAISELLDYRRKVRKLVSLLEKP